MSRILMIDETVLFSLLLGWLLLGLATRQRGAGWPLWVLNDPSLLRTSY